MVSTTARLQSLYSDVATIPPSQLVDVSDTILMLIEFYRAGELFDKVHSLENQFFSAFLTLKNEVGTVFLTKPRVNKKEKRVSNCLNTVYRVPRSLDILLYSCYDNTLSLSSTEHMQVYFVLCKQCLHTGILELDTLFSFLSTLD